jgi:hypothetical protein
MSLAGLPFLRATESQVGGWQSGWGDNMTNAERRYLTMRMDQERDMALNGPPAGASVHSQMADLYAARLRVADQPLEPVVSDQQ